MDSSSGNFPVVCFGEVLWDILPTGPLPGGAPMNVAYHLQKMGIDPALITRTGNDDYGRELLRILSTFGVKVLNETDTVHATGLVYATEGPNHEMSYDIVHPSAWDFIEWKQEYADVVSNADYFVFGSLTSRSDVSRNTLHKLLEVANTCVFDINIRPPHFRQNDIEYLLKHTDLLKMNLSELEMVTGWYGQSGNTGDRLQFMRDRFGISRVIVTLGGDGALVDDNGKIYQHPGYVVKVQDTIGSGDSFLAAFLAGLLSHQTVEKALDFAAATGAFVATRAGGCPDYKVEEIRQMAEEKNAQKRPKTG